MTIQVDQAVCAGCGVCLKSCPTGAIRLADGRAVIDDRACNLCEACRLACPHEAIFVLDVPVPATLASIQALATQSEPAGPGNPSRAGSARSDPGGEVVPSQADGLRPTLGRGLARAAPVMPAWTSRFGPLSCARRDRWQVRRRGRRAGCRLLDERR